MAAGASGPSFVDGRALISFLRNEARTSKVPQMFSGHLRAHVNSRIPRLRNGLDEEIVQQTWVHLLGLDKRRIRQSRDVIGLGKWFVRNYSVREVFAGYTAPGRKKRAVGTGEERTSFAEPTWARQPEPTGLRHPSVAGESDLCDVALARIALARAAASAPGFVAKALGLIYFEGLTVNGAAGAVGVDRTTLTRAISKWAEAEGFRADPSATRRRSPEKCHTPPR